ncbi:double-strand break repair protein AddB [Rhizosaccharibacter radicis]|uniref:Double-strand break repair protein AddB n=1 Tax=Rhizosaccharibacter radicis TaxID=2782605 RepID=A0ABT1W079_9PROT|nr:double-strand break repair protein AddB [Acetobacteraceae bacterium KSS12]
MPAFDIPLHLPILDLLADGWVRHCGHDDPLSCAAGTILLPTRRAARALTEAFLRRSEGAPMLLPRIVAVGALDETPLALAGMLDIRPAVPPLRRLALLGRLVLAAGDQFGTVPGIDQAWPLAQALADLMDEAQREDCDLAARLPGAADESMAQHWQDTLRFLRIVTEAWPAWLDENGLQDPVAHQSALLRAQAARWLGEAGGDGRPGADATAGATSGLPGRPAGAFNGVAPAGAGHPVPAGTGGVERSPVWAAGFTAAGPATQALLRAVLRLPQGRLVLHGLDRSLEEPVWQSLPASHPQAGVSRLLGALDLRRDDVVPWPGTAMSAGGSTAARPAAPVRPDPERADGSSDGPRSASPPGRVRLLSRALLPAEALGEWLRPDPALDLRGITRLQTADQQEEAAAIALILRDALEVPDRRAALVTPDRDLALRVAVELNRWGVVVDDSAGEPLDNTPPAVFLRLLATACCGGLSPVALLSLLKHPFAAAGSSPAECRRSARALERLCLRGPAPAPGIGGLRAALDAVLRRDGSAATRERVDHVLGFLARVEDCLHPLLRLDAERARFGDSPRPVPVPALIAALTEAAEALAATDAETGSDRLWSGEDGNALALHMAELGEACAVLPDGEPRVLCGLLDASLGNRTVRSRRVLRGLPDGTAEHPRLFIWGLLEARLQCVDLMVLGGLAETVWPPASDPGPWLSRPMRATVGLPPPEAQIGQSAHDFLASACAAPELVLSCPSRREGAPAVPARWLVRLDALLSGSGLRLPPHPAADWLRRIDQPRGAPRPVPPPAPRPPVALRPRRLSVTEIETWMRDPYAIHARHVLRLRPLPALEEPADAADYGIVVHGALARFLKRHGVSWPTNAREQLEADFRWALGEAALRPALAAWWAPRLDRIAAWVAEREAARRAEGAAPEAVATEIKGEVELAGPAGPFRLVGVADRIERRADGSLSLFDYKTGTPPSRKEVVSGWASQLVLEAAMAERGAFHGIGGRTAEILYWHLSGDATAGASSVPAEGEALQALVAQCWDGLEALVAAYDDPAQPFLSHPRPGWAPLYADYAQLARVAEWSAAREDGT